MINKLKTIYNVIFYLFLIGGSAFFTTFIIVFGNIDYIMVTIGVMVWIIGCFAAISKARGKERK